MLKSGEKGLVDITDKSQSFTYTTSLKAKNSTWEFLRCIQSPRLTAAITSAWLLKAPWASM